MELPVHTEYSGHGTSINNYSVQLSSTCSPKLDCCMLGGATNRQSCCQHCICPSEQYQLLLRSTDAHLVRVTWSCLSNTLLILLRPLPLGGGGGRGSLHVAMISRVCWGFNFRLHVKPASRPDDPATSCLSSPREDGPRDTRISATNGLG